MAVTNTQQCQFGQDQLRKASLDFFGFQTTFLGQQPTVTPNPQWHLMKNLSPEHKLADHMD